MTRLPRDERVAATEWEITAFRIDPLASFANEPSKPRDILKLNNGTWGLRVAIPIQPWNLTKLPDGHTGDPEPPQAHPPLGLALAFSWVRNPTRTERSGVANLLQPLITNNSRGFGVRIELNEIKNGSWGAVCSFLEGWGMGVCCGCWNERRNWGVKLDLERAIGNGKSRSVWVPTADVAGPSVLSNDSGGLKGLLAASRPACFPGPWKSVSASLDVSRDRVKFTEHLELESNGIEITLDPSCFHQTPVIQTASYAAPNLDFATLDGRSESQPILPPCAIPPALDLSLSLTSQGGFHPTLRISWAPRANLSLAILQSLPNTVFADPYQLSWLSNSKISYELQGTKELESPAHDSRAGTQVLLIRAQEGAEGVEIPLHLRYQPPSHEDNARRYGYATISMPQVYVQANGCTPSLPLLAPWGLLDNLLPVPYAQVPDGSEPGFLEFSIPIGLHSEAFWIRLATFATVLFGVLVVSWMAMTSQGPSVRRGKERNKAE